MKKLLLILTGLLSSCLAFAAGSDSSAVTLRPVTSTFMVSAGSAHRADTYLSPLKYNGWRTGIEYERFQTPRFGDGRWIMSLNVGGGIDKTLNRVRNSDLWGADLEGRWALWRRFDFSPAFTVGAGGSTTLNVGALYMSRNGNNPVAAKASWTVDLSALAIGRFTLGRLPVVAMYRATLPFVGAFFAPDYGQLYYEIYLGDTSGLVSPAVWGRYFRFDQRLTADLRLGGTTLRVGYGFSGGSTKVHSVTTQSVTHEAIIGVGGEWISLGCQRVIDPDARIIQAVY